MVNVVFLGAPGSGKGTQAAFLSQSFNIPYVSTGEILRQEVTNESDIGKLAKRYMNSGGLVPDKIVVDIIRKRSSSEHYVNGFILDGFPRNLVQGKILDSMLTEIGKKIDVVFDIIVPDDVVIKRISGRFSCKNCGKVYNRFFSLPKKEVTCDSCGSHTFENRVDDKEESVVNRLKIYHENSKELVEFYRKKDLIYSVDGLKDTTSVSFEVNRVVNLFLKNN